MMRSLSRQLRDATLRAIYRRGIRWEWITVAYQKWQHSASAEPCRYGREAPVALECRCRGCTERLCFLMFDQATQLTPPGH